MRYGHQVPQEDFSVRGMRVQYRTKYRGQELVLWATVEYKIWDRNYGMDFYRLTPDRFEEYGNLTHFSLSARASNVIFTNESE